MPVFPKPLLLYAATAFPHLHMHKKGLKIHASIVSHDADMRTQTYLDTVGKNCGADHGFRLGCQRSRRMMEKERAGKV